MATLVAKDALDDTSIQCVIPYTDFKPYVLRYILKC